MSYIENPKTKGSGIICCIPQRGKCAVGCVDCFFTEGRSYLEPLDSNLPNIPPVKTARGRVVRVNDGNDSNLQRELVVAEANVFEDAFFNTSITTDLAGFKRPVVLTVNPGNMTDIRAHLLDEIPKNLMFVRFRTNLWNRTLRNRVVDYYSAIGVPVVLTFMAFYTEAIPAPYSHFYEYRKRTLNSYFCVTTAGWHHVMLEYADNPLVYSCGKDERTHACARCGNCLREYFATKERTRVE